MAATPGRHDLHDNLRAKHGDPILSIIPVLLRTPDQFVLSCQCFDDLGFTEMGHRFILNQNQVCQFHTPSVWQRGLDKD